MIKRVIRAYADGLTGPQANKKLGVSLPTIYRIYDLIRERLILTQIYLPIDRYLEELEHNKALRELDAKLEIPQKLYRALLARRNVLGGQRNDAYAAELLTRLTEPSLTPDRLYADILEIIRLTGPLNAKNVELGPEFHAYYRQRFQDRLKMLERRHPSNDTEADK
jgi:hypothetical protein